MLEVKCQEYFDRVVAFAEKKGLKKELEARLDYLRKYADPEEKGLCKVELFKDFAPASFRLNWRWRNKEWLGVTLGPGAEYGEVSMNGGLIYHGDQVGWDETNEYVNPLTVRLGEHDNPWDLHT